MEIKLESTEELEDNIVFCAICENSIEEGRFLEIRFNNLGYSTLCRSCVKQLAVFIQDNHAKIISM